MTVRDLDSGYFALVMATGICSIAMRDVNRIAASVALLIIAVACFAILCAALTWRIIRCPRQVLADLTSLDRTFAFFTIVAACNVLAARLARDNHRGVGIALACAGAAIWLGLTYAVPVRLIVGSRSRPVLATVNGSWFLWIVATQSVAVSAATLDRPTDGMARPTALIAVLTWSVGVVLYLMVATLVLTRLLLLEVRPTDLTAPYWVTMGATAITVLAAAQILTMPPTPAVTATRPVVAGLAVVLWAFGTWLIPLLVIFGIRRHGRNRIRLTYLPALWSIVFPLGMYAAASMHLGRAAHMPLVQRIGQGESAVAVAAWVVVFAAMCRDLLRSAALVLRPATGATSVGTADGDEDHQR